MLTKQLIKKVNESRFIIIYIGVFFVLLINAIAQIYICADIDLSIGITMCAEGSEVSPIIKWASVSALFLVFTVIIWCYLVTNEKPI